MSINYEILMLLGSGLMVFSGVYRPDNGIIIFIVGLVLLIGGRKMFLREGKES